MLLVLVLCSVASQSLLFQRELSIPIHLLSASSCDTLTAPTFSLLVPRVA